MTHLLIHPGRCNQCWCTLRLTRARRLLPGLNNPKGWIAQVADPDVEAAAASTAMAAKSAPEKAPLLPAAARSAEAAGGSAAAAPSRQTPAESTRAYRPPAMVRPQLA